MNECELETAEFLDRAECIACSSGNLQTVAEGLFTDPPLRHFLENDPWGEDPLPYLRNQTWRYVRCGECEQSYQQYVLSPEWNERRFTRWMTQAAIEAFSSERETPSKRFRKAEATAAHVIRIERLTRSLRGSEPVKLLDFGCGYGDFIALCNLFGFQACGVDRSAAKRGNALVPVYAELEDLLRTEAAVGGFHAVTLFEVLEHVDEPRGLLEVLAPLMIRGGVLVIETPDCTGVDGIRDMDSYRKIHPLDHINAFTPSTLRKIVEQAGFRQIPQPTVHVTSSPLRVARTVVKRIVSRLVGSSTQQYFVKR